jgi:hypothetical protein
VLTLVVLLCTIKLMCPLLSKTQEYIRTKSCFIVYSSHILWADRYISCVVQEVYRCQGKQDIGDKISDCSSWIFCVLGLLLIVIDKWKVGCKLNRVCFMLTLHMEEWYINVVDIRWYLLE